MIGVLKYHPSIPFMSWQQSNIYIIKIYITGIRGSESRDNSVVVLEINLIGEDTAKPKLPLFKYNCDPILIFQPDRLVISFNCLPLSVP